MGRAGPEPACKSAPLLGRGQHRVWLLAVVAWKLYVPWDENRTRLRVDALP
jgi:hypothetical protein